MTKIIFNMIRHFFIDSVATIVKGSFENTSLNPIMEINYGNGITRGVLRFDEKQIIDLVEDKTFADISKLCCHLKMTNCFSVDGLPYEKSILRNGDKKAKRAASFELIAFRLPQIFDEGRGYDYEEDFWIENSRSKSNHGVSWFFARDGYVWPVDTDKIDYTKPNLNIDIDNGNIWIIEDGEKKRIHLDGGVYSTEFIKNELAKFENGEKSIIIDKQRFEFGNENMDMNITDYVIDIINGAPNYGIGIMFAPMYEQMKTVNQQYVGFFTDKTNTFFHPYIEVEYKEYISDDRENFSVGKTNRLYFYSLVDGIPTNLDELPHCDVDGSSYEVKQATKGVYYTEIKASKDIMESGIIGYDNWSNLVLNGEIFDDVEMEFEVKPSSNFIKLGSGSSDKNSLVPCLSGINDAEKLNRGEIREVEVDFRKKYTSDKKELVNGAEFRLYVKDATRKITVIDYQPVEKGFLNNFFIVHTEDLIPNEYYIDIKVNQGREVKYFKNVLRFTVVSDVTERYE